MNAAIPTTSFQVRKDALSQTRWQTGAPAPLAPGQVRLGIESFALTANNITYAAFGDAMNYWQFFPTGDDAWGCIPVWGFATVTQSQCEGVAVGEKFYGYYPMGNQVVLQPARVTPAGFLDSAAHRRELHPAYNQYLRCSADPLYGTTPEDIQSLLRPLFMLSFLVDDFMADNDFFGAVDTAAPEQAPKALMLLSSASSKTASSTAFQLAQRAGVEVVGLTSPGNVAFCEGLGCYSRVLAYEQLGTLAPDTPCIYLDYAGNAALRERIHQHFLNLQYSCSIGGTHVGQLAGKGSAKSLAGPRATLFFAPAQLKKRLSDWGPGEFGERLAGAWVAFTRRATRSDSPWLTVARHQGPQAMAAVYAQVLAGQGDPRTGHILQP
jgi:hypothetical protein